MPPPLNGRYKLVKKVGQGAFGEIYAGIDTQTQQRIACKLELIQDRKHVRAQTQRPGGRGGTDTAARRS